MLRMIRFVDEKYSQGHEQYEGSKTDAILKTNESHQLERSFLMVNYISTHPFRMAVTTA